MRSFLMALALLWGCIPTPAPTVSPVPSESPVYPSAGGSAVACQPTDQNAYVYKPARLVILAPCIEMTGTVAAIRKEADGDEHILVKPDPAFAGLVNAANSGVELGDLVVEPVCELPVSQADAVATCAADKDPLNIVGIAVGEHVRLTGRWVEDIEHGGWAELHPLYSWVPA